ncbi:MAG: hypothetical protein JWO12_99, partial [Frankiales bacterium]|nr:hypothetical protein [Frankiales bacterium]
MCISGLPSLEHVYYRGVRNEGLRALEGKNALFAATGQIQLLHAQTQLMELHLLQLIHGYASGIENF